MIALVLINLYDNNDSGDMLENLSRSIKKLIVHSLMIIHFIILRIFIK